MQLDAQLAALLEELEAFGRDNDAHETERARRMLNITRDTGEFLDLLVRATHAKDVLEVGTSNGYSTVWLAHALQGRGRLVTLELHPWKASMARKNLERASLTTAVDVVEGHAGAYLAAAPATSFDLLFLDSERSEYVGWWPHIERVLRPGGLLVMDNAVSHVSEVEPLIDAVRASRRWATSLAPVGNGEFLAVKSE